MLRTIFTTAAVLATGALAQTFTSCNPLNSTCPADAALGTTFNTTFDQSMSEFDPRFWNVTAGAQLISFGSNGANLPLTKPTDTITVQSNFYMMWGQFEINMRAAPGQGIISTAILISDDLDEIDWEIIGSNDTTVENNWYGWGNTTQRNAIYEPLNGAAQGYHNYTVDWNQDRIQYLIDGNVVRQVNADVPGKYPQTPMMIRFGIWPAGASDAPGTVEWAGGPCDFSKGPFVMDIKSIRITDGTQNVSSYSYTDHTGRWQSILGVAGESQAYVAMHTLTGAQLAQQRWNNLPVGAKIAIASSIGGVVLIGFIVFAFYFIGQRRKGRAERAIADEAWNQQVRELDGYREMMKKGQFAQQHMGHGQRI